jgi:cytochrome o ubiquinol oxidase subunit 2
LLSPSGDVALQQRNLIYIATGLMLLIIVPVIIFTCVFAWRYRASHKRDDYQPDWDHSTRLELLIWAAPLLIIIALGAVTWISTHTLDPYRPLDRISAGRPVHPDTQPLVVEVVALDWKWLFFYPEQGIATVNELAAPIDRPIQFRITSSSVMNSFFIPALAGQIYAMPGMETKLHAVANKPGDFEGFSANFSGTGFSQMRFVFKSVSDEGFAKWVAKVKAAGGGELTRPVYEKLELPSAAEPVHYYPSIDAGLYEAILNRCVKPGTVCMKDMMHMNHGASKEPTAMQMRVPATDSPKMDMSAPTEGGATSASTQKFQGDHMHQQMDGQHAASSKRSTDGSAETAASKTDTKAADVSVPKGHR